jgi:hypothetical protein
MLFNVGNLRNPIGLYVIPKVLEKVLFGSASKNKTKRNSSERETSAKFDKQ